jgi:hypothetical protein
MRPLETLFIASAFVSVSFRRANARYYQQRIR